MQITFGKTKTSEGGEVRSHVKTDHPQCVVKMLGRLFERLKPRNMKNPLFSWAPGSSRRGEGVRYVDVVALVKQGAEGAGKDPTEFSSHSLRRGGAGGYLMAGAMDLTQVQFFGRWKSIFTARLYMDWGGPGMSRDAQHKVLRGDQRQGVIPSQPPRERDLNRLRAKMAAAKMSGLRGG